MERYLKAFENCMEKEIPYCQGACPFNMEIFNFIEKAARGANKAAFKVYRNAVGYPRIANLLCPQPCKNVCPREGCGGAIEMGLLERAALEHTSDTSATDYNIPMKKERIAIIGAGISGMAALLRLSTKKYYVEVFEKTERLGGSLWDIMDSEVFLKDFDEQLAHQEYTIHFDKAIESRQDLEKLAEEGNFQAVYVATGEHGLDFDLSDEIGEMGDKYCRKTGNIGFFAGGGVIGQSPVEALAGGLAIGTVIDNYLKTGFLYYPDSNKHTRMCSGMVKIDSYSPAVAPEAFGEKISEAEAFGDGGAEISKYERAQGVGYTKEEAQLEAARCVKCHCSFCREHCDLIEFTGKWPIRIRDEIVATTLEGKSELKATPAKRLMSLCNQCGICKEVCPEAIDLDGLFMAGRKKMHRQGKAPWVFHDFFVKDMEFANSEYASVVKVGGNTENKSMDNSAKDEEKCAYAFFPGCQIGASEPRLVKETYKYLCGKEPDTGLILMCCGVPAEWSGDVKKHEEELERLKRAWEQLGKPVLILACPTCLKKFKEHLKEIPVISLYERLAELKSEEGADREQEAYIREPEAYIRGQEAYIREQAFYIFDACTGRGNKELQLSVRKLAEKHGVKADNDASELPRCCGFGGHGEIANPKYTQYVVDKRIEESPLPYITYCINCRDNFLEAGKPAVHILELIFAGSGLWQTEELGVTKKLPTVTQRRENRIRLKQELLKEFWSEKMENKLTDKKIYSVKPHISPEIEEKLNKERILIEDVAEVLEFCERTKRTIYNTAADTYSGYKEIGFMTLWLEYKKIDGKSDEFEIVNVYAHRMRIELEAVWNGRKCEVEV